MKKLFNLDFSIEELYEAKKYAVDCDEEHIYNIYIQECKRIKQTGSKPSFHFVGVVKTLINLQEINKIKVGAA